MSVPEIDEDQRDAFQELANVAVGLAADKVARSFSTFVKMPIPRVHLIESAEILMALESLESGGSVTAVTQSFFGRGIAGEALLLFTDSSMEELSKLMGYQVSAQQQQANELVLEMASLLNGSCVQGICSQFDITLLFKHTELLAQQSSLGKVLGGGGFPWTSTLAIELNYAFEGYEISCDLIILFHESSLQALFEKVDYLLD